MIPTAIEQYVRWRGPFKTRRLILLELLNSTRLLSLSLSPTMTSRFVSPVVRLAFAVLLAVSSFGLLSLPYPIRLHITPLPVARSPMLRAFMCRARICAGTYAHIPKGCITWSSLTGTRCIYIAGARFTVHRLSSDCHEREKERKRGGGFFIKARQSDQNMSLYQPRPFCPLYPSNGAPWSCSRHAEKRRTASALCCMVLFSRGGQIPTTIAESQTLSVTLHANDELFWKLLTFVRRSSMRILDLGESVCAVLGVGLRESYWPCE